MNLKWKLGEFGSTTFVKMITASQIVEKKVRALLIISIFCEYTGHDQLIPVSHFPYFDGDVVAFLEGIPLHLKCNLNLPQGNGDKLNLRRVARMIGVDECSTLVKRAIQFGSRIAKVSDKNRFGSQRRASGGAKHVCK